MRRVELVVTRTGVTKVMGEGAARLLTSIYPGRYQTRVMKPDESVTIETVQDQESQTAEPKRRGRPPKAKD